MPKELVQRDTNIFSAAVFASLNWTGHVSCFWSPKSGSGASALLLPDALTGDRASVFIINIPRCNSDRHKKPPSWRPHPGKFGRLGGTPGKIQKKKMKPENFYVKSPESLFNLAQRWETAVIIFLVN